MIILEWAINNLTWVIGAVISLVILIWRWVKKVELSMFVSLNNEKNINELKLDTKSIKQDLQENKNNTYKILGILESKKKK